MSAPVDVVLHIGTSKTGTTTLQELFRRNRKRLLERGVLYPIAAGKVRHAKLGHYAKDKPMVTRGGVRVRLSDSEELETFRRHVRDELAAELAGSGAGQLVLSDEMLFRLPAESMARMRDLLRPLASNLRLVVYLRRQDDHLVSRYQEAIKIGRVDTLAEWAERDFQIQYDYDERLRTWGSVLAPDQLVPRRFDRATFTDGSLEADFLEAAGMDVTVEDLDLVPVKNESLGAGAVEVLRILNLHRRKNLRLRHWQFTNDDYVERLRKATFGEQRQLTLPADELDRFQERWTATNQQVAREYFGEESGELFPTPARTSGRTTVQRLDPADFEPYLDLLEIAEADRPALRAIAEREAGRHR